MGQINGVAEDILLKHDLADYPIEIGEKDGWTYRKWNSGIAECWAEVSGTGTAVGVNTMVINFPFYFISGKFTVNATPARNATQVSWYGECNGAGNLQRGLGYCYFSYRLVSEHIPTFNVHVVGRCG